MVTYNEAVSRRELGALLIDITTITLLTFAPALAQCEPRLSNSLSAHVASRSRERISVIVHGTADDVTALAARLHLNIKKRMADGAVVEANSSEIEALAKEVHHLSRDVEVSSFMAVTDPAIGADQVHAGLRGVS